MSTVPELQEIKKRREKLGFNQKEFAKLCDIPPSLLNMIEKGNASPSYQNLVNIFNTLEQETEKRIDKLITAGKICIKNPITVKKHDQVEDVIKKMKSRDFSQIPVVDSTGCVGLVTEHSILKFLKENGNEALSNARAKDVMEIAPPIIDWNQKITPRILDLLNDAKCILVSNKGQIHGIIAKIDVIGSLKSR